MRLFSAMLLASVAFAPLCGHALADEADTQIRVVPYSSTKRVDVLGVVGQPTTFTFPKGEAIYRVVQTGKPQADGSIADAGWQGASPEQVKDSPLGNNLTLWPAVTGQSTMSVITIAPDGGAQKVYPFRLMAIPDDATALGVKGVVLNLIFQGTSPTPTVQQVSATTVATAPNGPTQGYKASPLGPVAKSWIAAQKAKKEAALEKLRTDSFNGADNDCHYHAHGKTTTTIQPRCPMDNGEWTLMRFPGLSKKPAVYIVTGENDERLARQHGSGDFVVVEEIAPLFRLRLGVDVLDIANDAYDPAGKPAGTGTITPTVEREILQAQAHTK